jgi:hypothetical protein
MGAQFIRLRYRVPARIKPPPVTASQPAGARLLAYLGTGAVVALIGVGLAVVVHPDHLDEAVRLQDLARAA